MNSFLLIRWLYLIHYVIHCYSAYVCITHNVLCKVGSFLYSIRMTGNENKRLGGLIGCVS